MSTSALAPERRAVLSRRSLWLAYATAGYNLLEGLVAIAAGIIELPPDMEFSEPARRRIEPLAPVLLAKDAVLRHPLGEHLAHHPFCLSIRYRYR